MVVQKSTSTRHGRRNPPSAARQPTPTCSHSSVFVHPSPHASSPGTGYKVRDQAKRYAAATPTSRASKDTVTAVPYSAFAYSDTFPGPLVLPEDDLAVDPNHPSQSSRQWAWLVSQHRHVKSGRRKVYVVDPPSFTRQTQSYMDGWERPKLQDRDKNAHNWPPLDLPSPATGGYADYLRAFYHGLQVERISNMWEWAQWDDQEEAASPPASGKKKKKNDAKPRPTPSYIGLKHRQTGLIYPVYHRPSPDGVAEQQICLNDVLDGLISQLPRDAFAIVMILDHDLFEDDDDDFCCGRAYGGSGASVASAFRYHPALETYNGFMAEDEGEHAWPASHCSCHVERKCATAPDDDDSSSSSGRIQDAVGGDSFAPIPTNQVSPLGAAIAACSSPIPHTLMEWKSTFFSRVARTASHEIGHCMGMDHCTYFACVMQGTASVAEDLRQPPYLCPVCLQKMSALVSQLIGADRKEDTSEDGYNERGGDGVKRRKLAAGQNGIEDMPGSVVLQRQWVKNRYQAIMEMCRRYRHASMFKAWEAWTSKRLDQIAQDEADQVSYTD